MPSLNAKEFYSAFEPAFAPGAAAADLTRRGHRSLKWTRESASGETLAIGFRLNRKNMADYPGEFMPDIFWSGVRSGPRDDGEVSFYQYALPAEAEAVRSLQIRLVARFIADRQLESELADPGSLTRSLSDASEMEIRPNHHRWLPYSSAGDATQWGTLFGQSISGWVSRFLANPETLEGWCRRV